MMDNAHKTVLKCPDYQGQGVLISDSPHLRIPLYV